MGRKEKKEMERMLQLQTAGINQRYKLLSIHLAVPRNERTRERERTSAKNRRHTSCFPQPKVEQHARCYTRCPLDVLGGCYLFDLE